MRTTLFALVVAVVVSLPSVSQAGGPRGYVRGGYVQPPSYTRYYDYGRYRNSSHAETLARVRREYDYKKYYGATHPLSRYQYSGNRGYDFRAGVNRFGEYYERYRTRR